MVLTAPTEYGFERLDIATYRLMLDDEARFVDVSPAGDTAAPPATDRRIRVYYGSFVGDGADRLANLPAGGCDVVYLVAASQAAAFQPTLDALGTRCPRPPGSIVLTF